MQLDDEKKRKALEQAEHLAEEFDPQEAERFAEKHKGAAWYEDFILLYRMVTDESFTISRAAYLAIAGALAYVVLPVDLIPDFIPGVGFIDDVFVVGFVMKQIRDEIARYRVHRSSNSRNTRHV